MSMSSSVACRLRVAMAIGGACRSSSIAMAIAAAAAVLLSMLPGLFSLGE
jgi:hypothetical protein